MLLKNFSKFSLVWHSHVAPTKWQNNKWEIKPHKQTENGHPDSHKQIKTHRQVLPTNMQTHTHRWPHTDHPQVISQHLIILIKYNVDEWVWCVWEVEIWNKLFAMTNISVIFARISIIHSWPQGIPVRQSNLNSKFDFFQSFRPHLTVFVRKRSWLSYRYMTQVLNFVVHQPSGYTYTLLCQWANSIC